MELFWTVPFSNHINNVCRTAYFYLRNNSRLRPALSQHSTQVLVNTLVTPRIEYCNAILLGIPNKLIHRLKLLKLSCTHHQPYQVHRPCHTPADSTALAPHIATDQLQSPADDISKPFTTSPPHISQNSYRPTHLTTVINNRTTGNTKHQTHHNGSKGLFPCYTKTLELTPPSHSWH